MSEFKASTEDSETITRGIFLQSIYDQVGKVRRIHTQLLGKDWTVKTSVKVIANTERVEPIQLSSPSASRKLLRERMGWVCQKQTLEIQTKEFEIQSKQYLAYSTPLLLCF